MGRRERAVFGGLLSGIGEGMMLKSSNRQKEEIANRKAIIDSLKEDRDFKRQGGLLQSTQPDEHGNVRGITRGGDVIDLGFKALPKTTRDKGELTDAQRQADAKARYTTEGDDGKVTNWPRVDAYLTAQGRPDLAAPRGLPADTRIDKDSDDWLDSQELAKKTAKDMERWNKFDTTVFEPFGGETQFIEDKTMEYYLASKGVAAGKTKRPDSGKTQTEKKPAESGTYKSADDVGKAYRNGRISKSEAMRILQEQFGL